MDNKLMFFYGSQQEFISKENILIGKLEIELERKMIIHNDRDPEIWKKPEVKQTEIEQARKLSSLNHQVNKRKLKTFNITFL